MPQFLGYTTHSLEGHFPQIAGGQEVRALTARAAAGKTPDLYPDGQNTPLKGGQLLLEIIAGHFFIIIIQWLFNVKCIKSLGAKDENIWSEDI